VSNTATPKITIITATYYRPDLLARAIRSVQESTFKEYEHIIVSDHCPKAQQVCDLFKEDKRIRCLEQEDPHIPNHGSRAHNLAIREAKSDLFCYLGDDNIVMPNHIELMYEELSGGEHDVVHTKTHEIRIGRGNDMIKKILSRDFLHDLAPEDHVKQDLLYSDPRDVANLGHTREAYKAAGPWKLTHECPKGIEDTEFFTRLDKACAGRILQVPVYTNVYYVRGSCFARDNTYHNAVRGLGEDEIFVHPEVLFDTRTIGRDILP